MGRFNLSSFFGRLHNFVNIQSQSRCLRFLPFRKPLPQPAFANAVMDIQKSQFPQEVVSIIQHVAESHFIAFDLEFSGIAGRRKVPPGGKRDKLTLQEMYNDLKEAAEKYQILQVGLTVVNEDKDTGDLLPWQIPPSLPTLIAARLLRCSSLQLQYQSDSFIERTRPRSSLGVS